MPLYEWQCKKCHKIMTKNISIKRKKNGVTCEKCGSHELAEHYTSSIVSDAGKVVSSKAARDTIQPTNEKSRAEFAKVYGWAPKTNDPEYNKWEESKGITQRSIE